MTVLEDEIFPYSSLLFFFRQETVCAGGLKVNYVISTLTVSVDFNCANALSLREFVALLEVESEHCEKTYHVTFKVVTSGVCLLKKLCCLNNIKLLMVNNINLFMEKD